MWCYYLDGFGLSFWEVTVRESPCHAKVVGQDYLYLVGLGLQEPTRLGYTKELD